MPTRDSGRPHSPGGSLVALLAAMLALALGWIAVAVALIAWRPFSVPAASMAPTIVAGDHILVSKLAYGLSRAAMPLADILPVRWQGRHWAADPKRGDLVVFKLPSDGRTDYLKRVIGLPGDVVQLVGGMVTINGRIVERRQIEDYEIEDRHGGRRKVAQFIERLPGGTEHRIIETEFDAGASDNTPNYAVPAGHVFVMGDNRDNSLDSRHLSSVGYVPLDNLVGRPGMIYASVTQDASAGPLGLRWDRMFTKID